MDVINFTENHILAKVVEKDGFVWYLTCFYGWPDSSQKAKSWALLSHLSSFVDGPWLCIGDFNVICIPMRSLVINRLHISRWMSFVRCWNNAL